MKTIDSARSSTGLFERAVLWEKDGGMYLYIVKGSLGRQGRVDATVSGGKDRM